MSRRNENVGFLCEQCGQEVVPLDNGSYRNHCPFCLFSKHVDIAPGDRSSGCRGLMEPVGLKFRSGKGFQIVHLCRTCSVEKVNRVADNTIQPDDVEELVRIS
ncbi:MAG: RNHCP domain-containing protein [bacterium]|jgi:hypothetical protein|nr:RNHCP domain-containing protein [bacterium]